MIRPLHRTYIPSLYVVNDSKHQNKGQDSEDIPARDKTVFWDCIHKKTQAVGLDNSSTNVTLQIRRQYLLCTDVCESVILLVNTANEKTKGSRVVTNS